MEKLVNIFNEIRSCYFPRWDIKKEWRIEVKARHPREYGFCDSPNKVIYVHPLWAEEGDGDLYVLIIHEICHAAASHWHDNKYQARLLKAADKAQYIGETELADKIRAEVKLCREATVLRRTSHDIYCQITDAVRDAPDASMVTVFAWVADQNLYTPGELLKRYPRAEKVYNQARKRI